MAETLPFTAHQAAALETQLYEIETAGLAMAKVLASGIDPEYQLCAASALNRVILSTFEACLNVLTEARALASLRVDDGSTEQAQCAECSAT